MKLKKLVLLCLHKLHMKSTTSISSALNLFFYVFYRNLKEKDHIKRNINSKKTNVYIGNQYYYFGFPIIRVGRAHTTSCLRPMENCFNQLRESRSGTRKTHVAMLSCCCRGYCHFVLKNFKNFMAPFYGWGSTASRLEPLRGGSLLFTTKFPEIPVLT